MEIPINQQNNRQSPASRSGHTGDGTVRKRSTPQVSNGETRRIPEIRNTSTAGARQRTNTAQSTASGRPTGTGVRRGTAQGPGTRPRTGNPPRSSQQGAQPPRSTVAARTASRSNAKQKRSGRSNPVFISLIVLLVVVIGIFAGIGVYALQYANYNKILPNVYVAGIDVGGMTVQEAKAAIEASVSTTEQNSVNVLLPDQALVFTPAQDTVVIDVEQAVSEAYNYGRNSTNPFAMSRAIKAAKRRRNDIDISTAVTIDTAYVRSMIDNTAAKVTREMTESIVDVDVENRVINVTIGQPGYGLDADTLYTLVCNAFTNRDYSDISFEYDMTYPATVVLDRLYEQLATEPKDACYNPDTGEIDPEVYGYTPNTDLLTANEQLAMARPGETLMFDFSPVDAKIHTAELEAVLFRDELYSYGSPYDGSNAGRTTNLRLACQAIDGYVVQPGEVFSFNEVVGERTAAKGYQEGVVYVNGNSEPALGGGICQVASTIYYCCMYADLEIVEREEHMYFVTYVPGGLDATVYWGSVDFKFRNSTDYPLRIDAGVYDGCVNISLVGTDVYYHTVEIESTMVSQTPFTTVTKDGTGEDVSGYTGYVYKITRYVYDSDGNLIRTDTTEDLDKMAEGCGTSTYEKRDKVVYRGGSSGNSNNNVPDYDPGYTEPDPAPAPDPEPAPEPDPEPVPDTPSFPDIPLPDFNLPSWFPIQ